MTYKYYAIYTDGVKEVRRKNETMTRDTVICKVVQTASGRLVIATPYQAQAYIIKDSGRLVKWRKVGGDMVAVVVDKLQIFTRPHFATYANHVLAQNRSRLHHNAVYAQASDSIQSIDTDQAKLLDDLCELAIQL